MASSGYFFVGTVSAAGSVSFSLPGGVTVQTPYVDLTITGPGGVVFDTGWIVGTSASGSVQNSVCGAGYSCYLASYCIGSDGKLYSGTIVGLNIGGPTSRPSAGGVVTAPVAGALNDMPATVTGTGYVSTVILTDLTASVDTSLAVVGGGSSAWACALPALVHGHNYRVSATFIGGPGECVSNRVGTVDFGIPAYFTRTREWVAAYAIGPAFVREWAVTYPVNKYVSRLWSALYQIDSPAAAVPSAGAITAALKPLHRFRARLFVKWDRTNWTEETERLLGASGVDDVDVSTRALNTAEASVSLDNSDDRFTPINRQSPIVSSLQRIGQEVKLVGGYDGYEDTIFFGYLESLHPQQESRSAELRALDRTTFWRSLKVSYAPNTLQRTDQIAKDLLLSAGLVDGVDFTLDQGDVIVPYAVAAVTPLLPELQALAQSEGGRLFLDSTGVLRFWSQSHTRRIAAVPLVELNTTDHLYRVDRGSGPAGLATRVTMEWVTREAQTTEIVYDLKGALKIPGGYAEGANYYPGTPVTIRCQPMDLTRWERFVPAEFISLNVLTANTLRDGSGSVVGTAAGSAPSPTGVPGTALYYSITFGVGYADIVFQNSRMSPVFVTVLKLDGKPQRSVSPTSVTVLEPDAAKSYGEIEARLANPYTPDADSANDRVREELAGRKDPLSRLLIPLQDGLPFLRPFDVLRVTDESVGEAVVTDGQVLRNSWQLNAESGYTQDLTLAPALPAQYRGQASATLIAAVAATATDTNLVYKWGADAHPLVWSFGQWN